MNNRFQLRIREMSGSAFCDEFTGEFDDHCKREEVSRILHNVASGIVNGITHGSCIDSNGNKVGTWCFYEE